MRGSCRYQAGMLFAQSGICCFGKSKHQAKAEARARGALSWSDMGKELGVYSYKTADNYRKVWAQVLDWAKANRGIKDMELIDVASVEGFLMEKLSAQVAHQTLITYCAAILKMESALNGYAKKNETGRTYNFRSSVETLREEGHRELARFTGSRAYMEPEALVAKISDPDLHLAATIQLEGGARIREALLIRPDQLKGLVVDEYTGGEKGQIDLKGKGGKEYSILVTTETYQELAKRIEKEGRFEISYDAYYVALRDAAIFSNQKYQGSHGLRWNFARRRMAEIELVTGFSALRALKAVSIAMGHKRADITFHYTGCR